MLNSFFSGAKINGEGVPEISKKELKAHLGELGSKIFLIDVRRPDEFTGELGHIEGSKLCTLGSDLVRELDAIVASQGTDKNYVFVCRSGGRSSQATAIALSKGFTSVFNLEGGMMEWNS